MKTQSTKKSSEQSRRENAIRKKIVTSSHYGIAILIALIAFIHVYLPLDNKEVIQAREAHEYIKSQRNDYREQVITLTTDYYNGEIPLKTYNKKLPLLLGKYQQYERESEKRFADLQNVKKENEVLGFSSWHTFLAGLGEPFIIFFLSVFLFLNAFEEKRRFLKPAKLFLASTSSIIGCFFLTWVFIDIPDLPFWSYIIVMLLCAVSATAGVQYLIQWLYFRRFSIDRFRKIIHNLIDFIVVDIRDKYIKKEEQEEYIDDTFETLKKGIEK